jgi:tRNA pseudouridine55 synthase
MRNREQLNGILLLDKPAGMTSHDAVQKVRKILCQPTVGHTGTLDPLAEGLLPVCIGRFTKLTGYLQDEDKCYQAELHLGLTSPSCDAETLDPKQVSKSIPELTVAQREQILGKFRGEIEQEVPRHSAVRIDGKRLYQLARQEERQPDFDNDSSTLELPSRVVTIHRLEVLSYSAPLLRLEVHCSKGTYIRSLARDIGEALGCGAYLSALRRTAIGSLRIESAVSFETLRHAMMTDSIQKLFVSPTSVLPFPSLVVRHSFVPQVSNGMMPSRGDIDRADREIFSGEIVMLRDPAGNLLALARCGQHWSERGIDGPLPMSFERVLV